MLFHSMYGIDLGSGTIKIYDQKNDQINSEPNMIAIRNKDTVFAVGEEAYEMFERTPQDIRITVPMSNGRISDVLLLEAVLHILLSRQNSRIGYRPLLFFTVPPGLSEMEKRSYHAIAHRGKLKRCRIKLVEKPIADALSLGIPFRTTKGSMIVNFGDSSTELSVVAEGKVIVSKTLPFGGRQLDEAVVAGVRRKNSFQIGLKAARNLKETICDLEGGPAVMEKVMGLDTTTGIPRDGVVNSVTVTQILRELLLTALDDIKSFLERTPPQVRESIRKEGIYVCGGGSRMKGFETLLTEVLAARINSTEYFELSTILGLKELMDHPELHELATEPKKRKE